MKNLIFLLVLLFSICLSAQSPAPAKSTIHFARLMYTGNFLNPETYVKNWFTDYPNMDEHVVQLMSRMTEIKDFSPVVVKLDPSKKYLNDDIVPKQNLKTNIYDYPILYVVEPEQVVLSDQDKFKLREYLKRGGTLFLDDFHGDEDFYPTMKWIAQITDSQPFELTLTHPFFHIHYDIHELVQVINDNVLDCSKKQECDPWENGPTGKDPKIFGCAGADGNLNIIMAFNEDLGDGLEWADKDWYPNSMVVFATKFITNTYVYSLTH